jgi:glutaredoxin
MTGVLVSAAASLVSLVFAIALGQRYLARGRVNRALVYWTVSLTMFFLATAAMFFGELVGWGPGIYRIFFLFGATLVVPWLAMGTVQISSPDRVTLRVLGVTSLVVGALFTLQMVRADEPEVWVVGAVLGLLWGLLLVSTDGQRATAGSQVIIAVYTTAAVVASLGAPMIASVPVDELPSASEQFGSFVVGFSRGGSGLGALLVVVGAVTAAVRLRGRGAPHSIVGNLLIGVGVTIAGLGAVFGDTEGHAIAFAVGVAVMYAGFVRTTRGAAPVPVPSAAAVPVVEVFTREDCGLCEEAERLALDEAADADVRFVDIDADPELQRRYDIRVPVVAIDGEEIAEGRVEPGTIRDALRRRRGSAD